MGRRRRRPAPSGGVRWLPSTTTSVPVSLLLRRRCVRTYLCAQIQRNSLAACKPQALHMAHSTRAQCNACSVLHVRLAMLVCCMHCYVCMARACMHTVLRLACSCRFSLTTLAGLHVAMLFEWCVQTSPSGHVGPPATAGNKRRLGKGLHKIRRWHGRSSSQEVEAYLVSVSPPRAHRSAGRKWVLGRCQSPICLPGRGDTNELARATAR